MEDFLGLRAGIFPLVTSVPLVVLIFFFGMLWKIVLAGKSLFFYLSLG